MTTRWPGRRRYASRVAGSFPTSRAPASHERAGCWSGSPLRAPERGAGPVTGLGGRGPLPRLLLGVPRGTGRDGLPRPGPGAARPVTDGARLPHGLGDGWAECSSPPTGCDRRTARAWMRPAQVGLERRTCAGPTWSCAMKRWPSLTVLMALVSGCSGAPPDTSLVDEEAGARAFGADRLKPCGSTASLLRDLQGAVRRASDPGGADAGRPSPLLHRR